QDGRDAACWIGGESERRGLRGHARQWRCGCQRSRAKGWADRGESRGRLQRSCHARGRACTQGGQEEVAMPGILRFLAPAQDPNNPKVTYGAGHETDFQDENEPWVIELRREGKAE